MNNGIPFELGSRGRQVIRTNLNRRISLLAIVATGLASAVLAQAGTFDNTATIRIAPLSKEDIITPKFGALVFDSDGITQSAGDVVVSPFTLKAVIGSDKVEVSVPEFQVGQVLWEADPIGCIDDDPKTKCHPTWGTEYSGQVGGDLPVHVEYANGGVFTDYGIATLFLNVTVVDNKVRSINGYLQITYSASTNLPNYRIPILGKLK
jgi:hypothetical protein